MFQTIGHKSGGFIQISYFGGKKTITAQHSYQTIGTYRTVSAAKRALTLFWRAHVAQRTSDHYKAINA